MKLPDYLDVSQKKAIQLFESDQSTFLTGKAGTGKSLILKTWREITNKEIVVLAPTGVAALNVEGQTIHSFFSFQPGILPHEAREEARTITKEKKNLLSKLDAIVIDEISMVRADLLDALDQYLSEVFAGSEEGRLIVTPSFGGIQLIFIGDLFQLPPVVTKDEKEIFSGHYPGPYFFQSQVFRLKNFRPRVCELDKIYRQEDDLEFQSILNQIRNRDLSSNLLNQINERVVTVDQDDNWHQAVVLTSQNQQAKEINETRLKELKGTARVFHAEVAGMIEPSAFPTDEDLVLKAGARVMFVKNDRKQGWVNGTMGTVVKFVTAENDGEVQSGVAVKVDDGDEVWVFEEMWEISRYQMNKMNQEIERIPVGSFVQIPLKLAWALTIHKSQGRTFPKLIIDLSRRMFTHGQAYVALSRGVSLEGIILTHPLQMNDVRLDDAVVNYFQLLENTKDRYSKEKVRSVLQEAIENQASLKLLYLNKQEKGVLRWIVPKQMNVMSYMGSSFLGLTAYCMEQQSELVFSVDRILKLKKIEQSEFQEFVDAVQSGVQKSSVMENESI